MRVKLLIESELPKVMKSKIELAEPKCAIPNTLKADPRRQKERVEIVLPTLTTSRRLNEEANRAMP